jgi:hypothetical protein
MGRGKPGKILFFSRINKVRKDPTSIPRIETKQESNPKLKSILPESIE